MRATWFLGTLSTSGTGVSMARSNPSALTGIFRHTYEGHPLPEKPTEPLVDRYLENTARYLATLDEDESGSATPVPSGSLSVSHGWSDATLTTGSVSGRCSTYSWGADEGELDRAAAETVRKLFDKINRALYMGKSTGAPQADRECLEWSTNFPHFRVHGIHLLDSMDDGTEMVAPDPFLLCQTLTEDLEDINSSSSSPPGLAVVGQRVQLKELRNIPECEHLHEEIIAADGIIEEYFAFDNTDEDPIERRKRSHLKLHHSGLPPVTPNACVRDAVCSQVFDQVWHEVIAVLQPVIRERASKGRSSSYSIHGPGTPSGPSPIGVGYIQHEPYILRGLRDPPTLTKAIGQSGSQYLRFKHSSASIAPSLPQLTNPTAAGLKDVMQIKSVHLQHRVPSTMMAINDANWEEPPLLLGRPESTVGSRLSKRFSDYQLPTTPASRLISSRLTNRRNVPTLRPIEKPKTPGLVPIDDGIRGYKLYKNPHPSPPSTPWTRSTQLPPLEATTSQAERSPPMLRSKNRVTFSSRILSAADSQDPWKLPRPSGSDLRPNTSTSTSTFRTDLQKSAGRKGTDLARPMKVVGHAAGLHGGDVLREKAPMSIAEDDEILEEENSSFAVTGISGLFPPKPKSGRAKLRGYMR